MAFHPRFVALPLALLLAASAVEAQQRSPHAGYVFPAGGRQGSTVQVKVAGQFLDGASAAYISGPSDAAVQATVVDISRPISQMEINQLREKLKALQDKWLASSGKTPSARPNKKNGGKAVAKSDAKPDAGPVAKTDAAASPPSAWSPEDTKMILEIRKKIATFAKRKVNPALAEVVTLRVAIAADAVAGRYELRLKTAQALTNPLVFCVGRLPEFSKTQPGDDDLPRSFKQFKSGNQARAAKERPPLDVTLPAVLNGQVEPGGVDRFRFAARQGQQLIVAADARELIPYISDAVPGWFQAAVAVYDDQGKELAYADHYLFHPDPVLHCTIPKDGQYMVEVRDSIYRGRDDFVYRVTIGELPLVTSIFPLGGSAGSQTAVVAKGWNLSATGLTLDARNKRPGQYPLTVADEPPDSTRVPYAVDLLPECLEREPNDRPDAAQAVALPIIVNGHIDPPGDVDVFRFEGHAQQQIVAEVQARRLGSPLDSVLTLTDSSGRQMAMNDDYEDKACGLETHHADSWLSATLPADGTYYLRLEDTQHKGGPEFGYRLRISRPRPDFVLRVMPSSISVRAGTSTPVTVVAVRRDGFAGEIAIRLKDAPSGFSLGGAVVPAGQDQVRLTLAVPPTPMDKPVSLQFEGLATIAGREVHRPGVPADDMMQAFAYHHFVPAQQCMVAVLGRAPSKSPLKLLDASTVKLPAGGTATVRVAVGNPLIAEKAQFALSEPPDGISIQSISRTVDSVALVFHADAKKVKSGLKGNLLVNMFADQPVKSKKGKQQPAFRARLGTVPAISFEITEPRPAP